MNKQMIKYWVSKTGRLMKPIPVAATILSLTFAVQWFLPQPVYAQTDPCTILQGTIETDNTFTESTTGTDFKITCTGELSAIEATTLKALLDGEGGYTPSQSTVIIDVSGTSGSTQGFEINTDAEKTILIGTIEDDEAATDGSVVSVREVGSQDNVDFESQATISSVGDGRIGLSVGAAAGSTDASKVAVENAGTITTEGDGADGLSAYFELDASPSTDAKGLVSVTNSGAITVSGNGDGSELITGLEAVYRTVDGQEDLSVNTGNVTVDSSGSITASGNRARGIYALTHGTGKVNIEVSGPVSAGHPGTSETDADDSETTVDKKFGLGIHAKANTSNQDPLADPGDDVDVVIVVSGSTASIMANGAVNNDAATTDFDESKGIAILAETGAETGHSMVEISNGAKVHAVGGTKDSNGYAVMFKGGRGTLDIDGANLIGNIMFTDKNDVLNIKKTGSIDGDVDFGSGAEDTMNIEVGKDQRFQITGDVTGLTDLNKEGAGYMRFGGNVEFGGADAALSLQEGALVIAGKLDLGTGEITVHEAGKIVFEIGKDGSTGSITADTIHFQEIDADDVAVYAQLNDDLTPEQVTTARTGLTADSHELLMVDAITSGAADDPADVSTLSIKTVKANGESAVVGSIEHADGVGIASFDEDSVNQIAKLNPDKPEPVSTGGDDDDNNVLLGLGLVAVLIALYWGDGLFGGSSFADEYAFNTPQSAYYASIDDRNILTIRESGNQPYQVWIRTGHNDTLQLAGVSSSGVSGTEIGLSLYRTDDFYIEAASAQNVTAQVNALHQQAQGEVYALSSGWRNDRYFAGVKLSHGDYDFNSIIHNPVVNSALLSDSEVTHTQAQFTAGTRLSTGGLEFIPSASIQAGSFDYAAHEAQGAALSAEVPAYTQDYSALRVGLKMSAGEWLNLSDDTKWKPHLQLDQIRTDSERNGDVSLRQRDKIGALSFNSGAVVQAMPEVVSALSFGASVKSSKSNRGEWRFGYAGLEAEGEYYHAAVAAYQMRF